MMVIELVSLRGLRVGSVVELENGQYDFEGSIYTIQDNKVESIASASVDSDQLNLDAFFNGESFSF